MRCTKNLTGNIYFHWDYGTTDESQADIIASDSPAHSILDPLRPRLQFLISRPQINADDWTLIIAKTGLLDGGRYECSVNTLPKISHTVALAVKEMAMAVIFLNKFLFNLYEAFFSHRTLLTKNREF